LYKEQERVACRLDKLKKMLNMLRVLSILLFISSVSWAQPFPSTIRGVVRDQETGKPMAEANLSIHSLNKTALSDAQGNYRFESIPAGRYLLSVSFVGYETIHIPEILLESGKEQIIDVPMTPAVGSLKEAVVLGAGTGGLSSVQAITIEQTLRYAATYMDPARVTTSFAGVAAPNDQANGLVIRGNSPNSMQWRLEGLEIVNPNHLSNAGTFSDRVTQTGGGVNILSTQMLGTSHFLTGAFPASYGNALSGILDMKLRRGNNEKREYIAQASLLGLDLAAEGPFSKKSKASYLANYRYSFTGLLGAMGVSFGGEDIRFQDFSFNIHVPTSKWGDFTIFGMGGVSNNTFHADRDTSTWEFQKDGYNILYKNKMGAAGVTHQVSLGERTSWHSAVAFSGLSTSRLAFRLNRQDLSEETLAEDDVLEKSRISANTILTHRFSNKVRLKTGIYGTFQHDELATPTLATRRMKSLEGIVIQPFASFNLKVSSVISAEVGAHHLYYSVSKSNSFEPRAALRFQMGASQQLSFSYGLHSQLQLPQVYHSGMSGNSALYPNRYLNPTRSHHYVTAYQRNFRNSSNIKLEAYWQELFDVPVSASVANSYSVLNLIENSVSQNLKNTGKGRNYGVEATYQKLLTDQYYVLITGSIYHSTYMGSDEIRRSTRFNGGHTFAFTGGKEFSKKEGSTWGINTKILWIGGFRDTPILSKNSETSQSTVYNQNQAFTIKMKDYFRPDLRIYWKKNHAKYNRTLAIDLQNVSGTKNEAYSYYDTYQKQVVRQYQLGLIPVLSYRWEF
jgi:hypothetical protein